MPSSRIVTISKAYVQRSLLFGLVGGAVVPAALVAFMFHSGFDPFLTVGAVSTLTLLVVILFRTYRRGIRQSIQLHGDRIVFDYLTYQQEYCFSSLREWRLEEAGKNWRLVAVKDGSSKQVPMSAFPQLLSEARAFYGI